MTQPDANLFAAAAGELHGRLVRSYRATMAGVDDEPGRGHRGIAALRDRALVTAAEAGQLTRLLDAAGTASADDRTATIRSVHHAVVGDAASGPVAVAICGIALNSAELATESVLFDAGPVIVADIVGGIDGALLGAEIPVFQPWTTLAGAVLVGGIASAVTGAS